jgi:hypothetical protein
VSPKPVGIRLDDDESVAPKFRHLVSTLASLMNKTMTFSHSRQSVRELSELQKSTALGLLGGYLSYFDRSWRQRRSAGACANEHYADCQE